MKFRPRYSLRFVLVLVTLAAVFVSMWSLRVRNERQALDAMTDSGGWVSYDYHFDASGNYQSNAKLDVPERLVAAFGPESFCRIVGAYGLLSTFGDEHLEKLAPLSKLRMVSNNHCWMGSRIGTLMLGTNDQITVANQFDRIPPPTNTEASPVTDVGLEYLSKCRSLNSIALIGQSITDKGVAHLTRLQNLEYLGIASIRVTDDSVPHLLKMPKLNRLVISGTSISQEGVAELKAKLPACKIYDDRTFNANSLKFQF